MGLISEPSDLNVADEVTGVKNGLICTIALLVTLLEERGILEPGLYKKSLCEALHQLDDEMTSPEAKLLVDFVRTLNDHAQQHYLL